MSISLHINKHLQPPSESEANEFALRFINSTFRTARDPDSLAQALQEAQRHRDDQEASVRQCSTIVHRN